MHYRYKGCRIRQTCGACPEQYDVFYKGEKIGYLRLRHGYFRAEYKGLIVYEKYPQGDGYFTNYEERKKCLRISIIRILKARRKDLSSQE